MAVFLRFLSKKDIIESKKFGIKTSEFQFSLTDSIDVLEWPRAFSEYIIEKITEDTPPSCSSIGVLLTYEDTSGNIPFIPIATLTPASFSNYFDSIFAKIESMTGVLKIEVTTVSIPSRFR